MSKKIYKHTGFMEKIFNLANGREQILEASDIVDSLIPAVVEYEMIRETRWLQLVLGVLVFYIGFVIGGAV